ncbi:hypothetical protein BH11VER1_BH11VER1_23030 [soil metagenome]
MMMAFAKDARMFLLEWKFYGFGVISETSPGKNSLYSYSFISSTHFPLTIQVPSRQQHQRVVVAKIYPLTAK